MGTLLNPRMTWHEYQQLPDDGQRYEVLEGGLVVTPSPGYEHQLVSKNIEYLLEHWRRTSGTGGQVLDAPFDVILADDSIVQPDLLYLSKATLSLLHKGKLHGAPDLVVEIFNSRGAQRDRVGKLQLYAKYRVKEYWLVDLEARCLTMLGLSGPGYETIASGSGEMPLTSRLLVGFTIRPRDAFDGC